MNKSKIEDNHKLVMKIEIDEYNHKSVIEVTPFSHIEGSDRDKLWWAEAEIIRLGNKLIAANKEKSEMELQHEVEIKKWDKKYKELGKMYMKLLKTKDEKRDK